MNLLEFRSEVLRSYGVESSVVEELLAYNENIFESQKVSSSVTDLLSPGSWTVGIDSHSGRESSEPFIVDWIRYVQESKLLGIFPVLRACLVQLQFPIRSGISETDLYREATRKGIFPDLSDHGPSLDLQAPDRLQLWIQPTLAGSIPVIVTGCRADFIALVQALTRRNEPSPIPDSMGACIVSGYNNWDRIRRYKQQWLNRKRELGSELDSESSLLHPYESEWLEEFKRLIPQKHLYQDRFILLSSGPYSNVSASELGLADEQWIDYSLTIRLEHECTHYFTRRFFNSMRNNLLDELIADYMGIVSAIGYYRADWFLRFIGLDAFPLYREGGRLENYRGSPRLSDSAFKVLQQLVKQAAENLERFDRQYLEKKKNLPRQDLPQKTMVDSGTLPERSAKEKMAILIALTSLTLEELADKTGDLLIEQAIAKQH